jgi:hypothetical protein
VVTLEQMLLALTEAVEFPCHGTRVLGVPEIRARALSSASHAVPTL